MANMTIPLNGKIYHSLTEMAQDSPQNTKLANVLKRRGTGLIDSALRSFVKLQAKEPYSLDKIQTIVNGLQDLEGAVRECSDRSDKWLYDLYEKTEKRAKELTGETAIQPQTLQEVEKDGYRLVDKRTKEVSMNPASGAHIIGTREEPQWNYDKIGENREDTAGLDLFAADLNMAVQCYTKAMLPEPVGRVTREWMQQWMNNAGKATQLLSKLRKEAQGIESKRSGSYLLAPEVNLQACRTQKGIFGKEKKKPLYWSDGSGKKIRTIRIQEPVEKLGGNVNHLSIRIEPEKLPQPSARTFVIQGKTFALPDLQTLN